MKPTRAQLDQVFADRLYAAKEDKNCYVYSTTEVIESLQRVYKYGKAEGLEEAYSDCRDALMGQGHLMDDIEEDLEDESEDFYLVDEEEPDFIIIIKLENRPPGEDDGKER